MGEGDLRLAEVVVGDVGFVLSLPSDPERVRAPDVAFLSTARPPKGRLPQGFIRGAPELAVEVLSPSDNPVEVQQKVYRPDGSACLVREPESLDGEDVVAGLAIPLADLFE
jgi:Uma2 family endonuclease